MEKIPARFVSTIPGTRARGVFRFFTLADSPKVGGMLFRCPGCGEVASVGFTRPTRAGEGVWTWDGDRTAPTLTPSILHDQAKGGCGWHGHLTAGVWTPC